jgi:predicted nucleotidyltransferase component of viral defense system
MLRTDTLEKSTLALLKKLQAMEILGNTRLVGGTALALQLGHRVSVDLDIFGIVPIDANQLSEELNVVGLKGRLDYGSNNIKQFTINNVKVDFVNYQYKWLEPVKTEEGIRLADLKDITAMKLEAITNRGTRRDFVDVYFLLKQFPIKQQLELYLQKYPDGSSFNVLRSLTYFDCMRRVHTLSQIPYQNNNLVLQGEVVDDAETAPMPKMLMDVNWDHIKASIREAVAGYQ